MKLKYFMRGLGSGIIMTTLVLTLTKTSPTDDEVMRRAAELGMVIESDIIADHKLNEEEVVESSQEELQEKEEIKEETNEEIKEKIKEKIKEETQEELEEKSAEYKDVYIEKGMYSHVVSQILQDRGIVEDAKDFDHFLIENGYQRRIQTGTYSLSAEMSYDELAQSITK